MCSHITISAQRLRELASSTLDSIKIHRGELLEALIVRRRRELELERRRPITNFFRHMLLLPKLPDPIVTWDEAQKDVLNPYKRNTDWVGKYCALVILQSATEFAKRDYEVAAKLLRAANLADGDGEVVVSVEDADCLWVTPRELVDVGKTDA